MASPDHPMWEPSVQLRQEETPSSFGTEEKGGKGVLEIPLLESSRVQANN